MVVQTLLQRFDYNGREKLESCVLLLCPQNIEAGTQKEKDIYFIPLLRFQSNNGH